MAAKELYTTPLFSDANLLAYWRMEGNSNDSKSSFNGTDTAMTYSASFGKFGSGAGFNGSTSKIDFGNPIIPIGVKTMMAWVKLTSAANEHTIIANSTFGAQFGDYLGVAITSGYLRHYAVVTGGNRDTFGTTNIADNNWHHVAVTYDGTNSKLYVDGVLEKTSTSYTDAGTRTLNLQAGMTPSMSYNKTNGGIDDVAIFNRELTILEIQSYYNGTLTFPGGGSPMFFRGGFVLG